MKIILWGCVGLVGLITLMTVVHETRMNSDPAYAKKVRLNDAIDLCWREQQRKSLAPLEARFIAGACEELERQAGKR